MSGGVGVGVSEDGVEEEEGWSEGGNVGGEGNAEGAQQRIGVVVQWICTNIGESDRLPPRRLVSSITRLLKYLQH